MECDGHNVVYLKINNLVYLIEGGLNHVVICFFFFYSHFLVKVSIWSSAVNLPGLTKSFFFVSQASQMRNIFQMC